MNERKFLKKAGVYEKARPNYPERMVDELFEFFLLGKDSCIADIGSGTGKLTRQLLSRGSRVFAVEPNADMRGEAELQLGEYSNFISINGSAERTTLHNESVDCVVAAQAFHWFDASAFRVECERILKKPENIALIWNRKDLLQDVQIETKVVYRKYCPEFVSRGGSDLHVIEKKIQDFFGGGYEKIEYENNLVLDLDGFIQMNLSQSYAPIIGERFYEPYVCELTAIFYQHSKDGRININNKTFVYRRFEG